MSLPTDTASTFAKAFYDLSATNLDHTEALYNHAKEYFANNFLIRNARPHAFDLETTGKNLVIVSIGIP